MNTSLKYLQMMNNHNLQADSDNVMLAKLMSYQNYSVLRVRVVENHLNLVALSDDF